MFPNVSAHKLVDDHSPGLPGILSLSPQKTLWQDSGTVSFALAGSSG